MAECCAEVMCLTSSSGLLFHPDLSPTLSHMHTHSHTHTGYALTLKPHLVPSCLLIRHNEQKSLRVRDLHANPALHDLLTPPLCYHIHTHTHTHHHNTHTPQQHTTHTQ